MGRTGGCISQQSFCRCMTAHLSLSHKYRRGLQHVSDHDDDLRPSNILGHLLPMWSGGSMPQRRHLFSRSFLPVCLLGFKGQRLPGWSGNAAPQNQQGSRPCCCCRTMVQPSSSSSSLVLSPSFPGDAIGREVLAEQCLGAENDDCLTETNMCCATARQRHAGDVMEQTLLPTGKSRPCCLAL